MTRPVVVVGCGKAKRLDPHPAADLYTSAFIVNAVKWARSVNAAIFILTAKYGLIPGTKIIPPYDATWSGPSAEPTVPMTKLAAQIAQVGLSGPVITLAGSEYRERLINAAEGRAIPHNPYLMMARERYGAGSRGYQTRLLIHTHGKIPLCPEGDWFTI